jgi:Tol biopolymer transport system component
MTPPGVLKNASRPTSTYQEFVVSDPTLTLGCSIWSPDGNRLAYEAWDDTDTSRNGIYTTSAVDGSDLQRLTSSPDGGHDIPGDFSADGSKLFFTRRNRFASSGLMVVGMDGSDPQRVTGGASVYSVPNLSPDDQTLVAVSYGHLYLIGVDGRSSTQITIPDATSIGYFGPSWSPDGSWIVFQMITTTRAAIARVRPDGSGLFLITDSAADQAFPDWAP